MTLQHDRNPPRVAGIVLAAGAGRRMGGNKMRLPLDGEALIRRAVRVALDAGLSPVVVVVGHQAKDTAAELEGLPCETVANPDSTGPASDSLRIALQQLPDDVDAAVVLLGDMVYVTAEMVRSVNATAGSMDAAAVASRYDGLTAPPILFRRELFPALLAWEGEAVGDVVTGRHPDDTVYVDWPSDSLGDIDTPADYDRARETIRRDIVDNW